MRIHIHTHRPLRGIYKIAVEMGSSAMICMVSFVKIGSKVVKEEGMDTQTHREHCAHLSLVLFYFQNKESRTKRS
jgi:hypothetical protein